MLITVYEILTFGKLRHYAAVLEEKLAIPPRETYAFAVAMTTLFAIMLG